MLCFMVPGEIIADIMMVRLERPGLFCFAIALIIMSTYSIFGAIRYAASAFNHDQQPESAELAGKILRPGIL